ncbi:MAG: helix-turn-helix domain-containing protein [Pseudomonadota bacterium]
MPLRSKTRIRRSPEDAKQLFLNCAQSLLVEEGLRGVQMRAVARRAGVTDAAIAHHFGNREGLLSALMEHVVSQVRDAIRSLVAKWTDRNADIGALIEDLDGLYRHGYAELAHAASQSGWRDKGAPILKPVIDVLIRQNQNPTTTDDTIRHVMASVHQDLALSPLYGEAFRRSVGLRSANKRTEHLAWWAETIERLIAVPL